MYVRMYVCMYECMYLCICVCVHVCMCVHVCVCVCVCIYVELVDNKYTHATSASAYVLELQIEDHARRLGLGTLLMEAVEEIAAKTSMDSTMLCVFRYNEPAVNFYLNKLGYVIDQSSAFNDNQKDVWELVKPNHATAEKSKSTIADDTPRQHLSSSSSSSSTTSSSSFSSVRAVQEKLESLRAKEDGIN